MRLIKRWFLFLVISAALLAGIGAVFTYLYEDEVKIAVVSGLNSYLETEVKAEAVDLTVWSSFPYAGLRFTDVAAKEKIIKIGELDTLFHFEQAEFRFNLIDLYRKNYNIKKVVLSNGYLRPRVDEEGYDNYHIWKSSTDTSARISVELEEVVINNVQYLFTNELKKETIDLQLHSISFSGAFSSDQYALSVEGETFLNIFKIGPTHYASQRSIKLQGALQVNQEKEEVNISRAQLEIDRQLNFELTGLITSTATDLEIKGHRLDILSTLNLLPQEYRKNLGSYQSDGILDFSASIQNAFSTKGRPSIDVQFGITDATIHRTNSQYSLQKVFATGSFSNGKQRNKASSELILSEFKADLGNGNINGKMKLRNFDHHRIETEFKLSFELQEFLTFFGVKSIDESSGSLSANVSLNTRIKNLADVQPVELQQSKGSGKLVLTDASVKFTNNPRTYRDLNGTFLVHNNDLLIKELQGSLSGNDFELTGLFRNMLSYLLLKDQQLTIEAELYSPGIQLDQLLASKQSDETSYALPFQDNIRLNLDLSVDSLVFQRFKAREVMGILQLVGNKMSLSGLYFQAMDGDARGQLGLTKASENNILFKASAELSSMDIGLLFQQFENFGQSTIQSRHLEGKLNASFELNTALDSNLNQSMNDLVIDAFLELNDGRLLQFEPMKEISNSIRDNTFLNLLINTDQFEERLMDIRFDKLENHIRIEEQVIYIPEMSINSSAMDIDIAGKHTFSDSIHYEISFWISEILRKKKKEQENKAEFIDEDERGGIKWFMTMTGTMDNPSFHFKRPKIKTNLKKVFKETTKDIGTIAKEEWKVIKGDTTIATEAQKEEPVFLLEWEEDTTLLKSAETKPDSTEKKPKKGWRKLLKKLEEGDEQNIKKGQFEIDEEEDDY